MKESFEQEMAEVPFRRIPPEWEARMVPPSRRSRWAVAWAFLREALAGPPRFAWGALAAGWVVILFLSFSGPRGEDLCVTTLAERSAPRGDVLAPETVWQLQRRYVLLSPGQQDHVFWLDPRSL